MRTASFMLRYMRVREPAAYDLVLTMTETLSRKCGPTVIRIQIGKLRWRCWNSRVSPFPEMTQFPCER
jgi:hypothetical protein